MSTESEVEGVEGVEGEEPSESAPVARAPESFEAHPAEATKASPEGPETTEALPEREEVQAPPVTNLESFLAVDDALDPEEYRTGDGEGEGGGELPSTESDLDAIVEALLFVADKPLKPADLAERAHCAPEALRESILRLQEVYAARGIRLVAVAGGFAFRTAPEVAEYVREATAQKPVKLTRAQLETLAILAYRQPMTRPEIDDVRGVDSGPVLKLLLERHLVRILGKKEEPGRPLLYGTTSTFLELFGLRSIRDLPTLREFTELTEESRRTMEKKLMGEEPAPDPEAAAAAATEAPAPEK